MFREVREIECITEEEKKKLEEEDRKNRKYLEIKPETNMTIENAKTFWNTLF